MTTTPVTPRPIILNNCTVQIGATNTFEKACSTVSIVPSVSTVNFNGMAPTAQYALLTTATWVANLTLAQDMKTASSLWNYLWANQGTSQTLVFIPDASDPLSTVTVTIIVPPPSIGGDVNTVPTSAVAAPVQGQPTVVSGS